MESFRPPFNLLQCRMGEKHTTVAPSPLRQQDRRGFFLPDRRSGWRVSMSDPSSSPPLPLAQCNSQGFRSATLQSALFITLFKKNKKNKKVNKMITIQSSNSHLGSRNMLQYKTAANMTTTPQNKPARVGSSHSVGRTIHFRGGEACQCY